jgi:hypothetical protein
MTWLLLARKPNRDWGVRQRCQSKQEAERALSGWEACAWRTEPDVEFQIISEDEWL